MAKQRILACPLCGETQYEQSTCRQCEGALDPDGLLLAEASFGPWYVRDEQNPFAPGMTYDILVQRVRTQTIHPYTLVRGPTTRQLWIVAKRVPGIAHLLGRCHKCDEHVDAQERGCPFCKTAFGGYRDRDSLGLEKKGQQKVEAEGVSSFLGDTAIFDTCSQPLTPQKNANGSSETKPMRDVVSDEDTPGSPAFRALQRRIAQLQRRNRALAIATSIVALALVIAVIQLAL
ncbi:MAG: hypothetical protein QGI78_03530 [Phycisphaerales bacterium]|jgi:hypothetical protein|nr:hypothetical protein [Phycisphaerales bacterium]